MNIPDKCDKCGCTPTVDPITDVIDLTQVCGITLGVQLDREHWLCSTCAAEFGGGVTDPDQLKQHFDHMMNRYSECEEYGYSQEVDASPDWEKFDQLWSEVTGWKTMAGVTDGVPTWFLKATEPECLETLLNMATGEWQQTLVENIKQYANRTAILDALQADDRNGCYTDVLAIDGGMDILTMDDIEQILMGSEATGSPERQYDNIILIGNLYDGLVLPLFRKQRVERYYKELYPHQTSLELEIEGCNEEQIEEMMDIIERCCADVCGCRSMQPEDTDSTVYLQSKVKEDLIHLQYKIALAFDRDGYDCDLNDPVTGFTS